MYKVREQGRAAGVHRLAGENRCSTLALLQTLLSLSHSAPALFFTQYSHTPLLTVRHSRSVIQGKPGLQDGNGNLCTGKGNSCKANKSTKPEFTLTGLLNISVTRGSEPLPLVGTRKQ